MKFSYKSESLKHLRTANPEQFNLSILTISRKKDLSSSIYFLNDVRVRTIGLSLNQQDGFITAKPITTHSAQDSKNNVRRAAAR
jgi:hypothetical protein